MQGFLNLLIVILVSAPFLCMVIAGIIRDKARERKDREAHPIFYHMQERCGRERHI